tara:strand:- start:327 stop:671 length:345 start_codon:yes stop_codon:yes gene_type:complete
MASFPTTVSPSFGATKSSAPSQQIVSFNGYEQRIKFGINQNPKVWTLAFENITETEADEIETFLNARADDGDNFDWSPPDDSGTYKWVCDEWEKSIPHAGRANINTSFRQVFEA